MSIHYTPNLPNSFIKHLQRIHSTLCHNTMPSIIRIPYISLTTFEFPTWERLQEKRIQKAVWERVRNYESPSLGLPKPGFTGFSATLKDL